MNISLSRIFVVIVGALLIGFGAWFLVQAIPVKDWIEAILAVVAIAVGFALISGRGVTVNP